MINLRISGLVQGVGFRWFVLSEARRLRLKGWVRNHPDGSVELLAGGSPEALNTLRAHVARGPRGARVEEVTELPIPSAPAALPDRFEIK